MAISLAHQDILETSSSGIILTIDGLKKGLEGNIARAFARRWPEAFEELVYAIPYPLPIGRTALVELDVDSGSPFRYILVASTLHHLGVLSDETKKSVMRSALSEAIGLATRRGCTTLATPVLTGGWRISFQEALSNMLSVAGNLTNRSSSLELLICIRDAKEMDEAQKLLMHK